MGIVKAKPAHVAALIVAALLTIGVLTFAGPCIHEDGSVAACHGAASVLLDAGITGCVAALVSLLAGNPKVSGACALVVACCGAFVAAAPGTLLGLCMMQTMRCWTVMRPFALVCGVVLFSCAVVAAVRSFASSRGRSS